MRVSWGGLLGRVLSSLGGAFAAVGHTQRLEGMRYISVTCAQLVYLCRFGYANIG